VTTAPRTTTDAGLGSGAAKGAELAASVVVFFGIGWLLDAWLGTRPLFMIVCLVFAVVGHLVRVWYAYDHDMRRHEAQLASRTRGAPTAASADVAAEAGAGEVTA
jgi:Flp pilus assembly protein TadB